MVSCGYGGSPGPGLVLDFLPCGTGMFVAISLPLVIHGNTFSGRFNARDDLRSSKWQKSRHSSYLYPLWRFLRQIGWPISKLMMNWPPSFDRYGGQLPRGLVYWLSSRHCCVGGVGGFLLDAVVLECVDPEDGFGAGLDGGIGVGGDFATRSYRVGGLGVA